MAESRFNPLNLAQLVLGGIGAKEGYDIQKQQLAQKQGFLKLGELLTKSLMKA